MVLAAGGVGGRADHDVLRGPVAQLDGHGAGERIGGVGDRVEVAAGGLGEVVHDHRMRARCCRGRGRSQLEHAGVGARAFLLRQNSLKIGERAHVVGEIREQRAEARDCRVLAFERGQLVLPGRFDILEIAHDFGDGGTDVESRTAGWRPEAQSDCTHRILH